MNNKKIIGFVAICFFVSAFVLAYIERGLSDENYGKNWWAVYFASPKEKNIDFIIENHSDRNKFNFEIVVDKKVIYSEDDVVIAKGNSQSMLMSDKIDEIANKKIEIIVSDGRDKKEIYKNY